MVREVPENDIHDIKQLHFLTVVHSSFEQLKLLLADIFACSFLSVGGFLHKDTSEKYVLDSIPTS